MVLPVDPALTRDDLLESSSNKLAVDLIDHWPDWPSNVVVLAGPVGSGKSHMARIWALNSHAKIISMSQLADHANAALSNHLVLEDAQIGAIDENALFHTLNQARAHKRSVLMTSRTFPSAWLLELPDLISRIKLAHVVELQEPDDALLSSIIMKLFADRQLEIAPQIIDYLVNRMERSMEAANQLVNWMDNEALARRRKINRTLASEALKALDM
jgi:chromosomal replication initiation ATPase DnaA